MNFLKEIRLLIFESSERPTLSLLANTALCFGILVADFGIPLLLREIILLVSNLGGAVFRSLGLALFAFFFAHLAKALFSKLQVLTAFNLQNRVLAQVRDRLAYGLVARSDSEGTASAPSASELSGMTRDLSALEVFLQTTLWQTGISFIFFILGAGLLFFLNPILAICALLPAPVIIFVNYRIRPLFTKAIVAHDRAYSGLQVGFQELVEGNEQIRSYEAEEAAYRRVAKRNLQVMSSSADLAKYTSWQTPLFELGGGLAVGSILLGGMFLMQQGQIQLPVLLSFIVVLGYFYRPVFASTRLVENWRRSELALERLLAKIRSNKTKSMPDAEVSTGIASIRLTKVELGYAGLALSPQFELELPAGKIVGITGPNGAGKSTLLKTIAGLIPVVSGSVHFGKYAGIPKGAVAYLPQNPFFFDASAYENLEIASDFQLDRQEVLDFAEHLGLELSCILALNPQVESVGLWAQRLSGGQRQRLSLLRFALRARRASYCFLDEPTNFIDLVSEKALIKTLFEICCGKTAVVVSHRKWVLDRCDYVMVMDRGGIFRFEPNSKRRSLQNGPLEIPDGFLHDGAA